MQQVNSIKELVELIEKNYRKKAAFNEKAGDRWVSLSHEEFLKKIKAFALYLNHIGIKKGDRVGILALPGINWTIADMASLVLGAITVPLFANISEENFIFEITQTDAKTIFVSGEEQWAMYDKHASLFDNVIALDNHTDHKAISFDKAIEIGHEVNIKNPGLFDRFLEDVQPDDVATIIYTSGSTGLPKGVVLTQRNLVGITHSDPLKWNPETDRYLSILPLAHIFGRSLNFIMIQWGIDIYYFNDLKNVGVACREIHPTITALVPRLLEKIYAKMVSNVESQPFLKRTIGTWAFSLATAEDDGLLKNIFHPIADKIVYQALRDALGGSFRIIISGGAPLNPHLCRFFIDIGIPIYEGYGLTEAAICSVNRPGKLKIGTVGPKIDELELKISPSGELLVKGALVLKEYYKNPQATSETLIDGWLHTGDKANIDEEGFVTIEGRIKDLVKSSIGEFIAPVPIEQQLGRAPFIDLSMVVAERRKYVSVLIFPNFEVVQNLKAAQKMEHLSDEEFLNSDYIRNEMNKLIESINSRLNHWEQIHAYKFIMTPPTIESGELTPSMKIRRDVVQKKYKDEIDSLYPEEAVPK